MKALKFTPQHLLSSVVILIPVICYLSYGYSYSGPIFWGDDFDLLETVTRVPEANSFSEKLFLWFKQQNEHRVVFPRLITYLDYQLEGFINWRSLILFANLVWVGILYFFWSAFRSMNLPLWMFIPVSWLLFQPQYYENMIWATSILQQSNVVFWLSFTVFLYAKGYPKAALLPALVATFSHGSGLSSFIVILFLILTERKWHLLPYWIASTLAVVLLYFFRLEKGQSANFSESISNIKQLILSFFAFSGSMTRVVIENPLWAAAAGFLMMLILSAYLLPKFLAAFKPNKPEFSFFTIILIGNIAFFAISAALVSISRSWAGLESIMPPRYQHYTVFLAGWTYLVILKSLSPTKIKRVAALLTIAFALLFNLLSYVVYSPSVIFRQNYLIADETNYLNHQRFLQYHWTFNRNINNTYKSALDKGVVRMKKQLPDIVPDQYPTDTSAQLLFSVTPKSAEAGSSEEEILWIEGHLDGGRSVFLYFMPEEGDGYWIPLRGSRPAFRDLILKGITRGKTYRSELDYANLPEGDYRVGILHKDDFSWTPGTLDIRREALPVSHPDKSVL